MTKKKKTGNTAFSLEGYAMKGRKENEAYILQQSYRSNAKLEKVLTMLNKVNTVELVI